MERKSQRALYDIPFFLDIDGLEFEVPIVASDWHWFVSKIAVAMSVQELRAMREVL